jgi:signal transduction histidine kinase
MSAVTRKHVVAPATVVILVLVLAALTYFQYKWAKQVSDASRAHVTADLRKSILGWHLDLFRSLAGVPVALRLNAEPEAFQDQKAYAKRYQDWRARASYPNIVANVYIWDVNDKRHSQMLRLNPATGSFEPAPWPERFDPLGKRLQKISSSLDLAIAGVSSPEAFFADHPQKDRPFEAGSYTDDSLEGWIFEPRIPVIFHPVAHVSSRNAGKQRRQPLSADWVIIEYDTDYLRKELLPVLAQRYFAGHDGLEYQLAVVSGLDPSGLIYSSDAWARTERPDVTMNLFAPLQPASVEPPIVFAGDRTRDSDPQDYSAHSKSYDFRGAFWFPVMPGARSGEDWYLLVKYRHGSFDEMFAREWHRNLAISFGVLLLLVVSMGLVLLASRRAQHLAKLQVDFVAGVSHDLRTPLAVMSLAADNLADGVVDRREAVVQYGVRLQSQVRQLTERVEQILDFASLQRRVVKYVVRPVEVSAVIDAALRNTAGVVDEAGVTNDVAVEADLPPISTDPDELAQVLQNLITNAVKYGGEDGWLGIRAALAPLNGGRTEVQIMVEDHGIGIDHKELDRIFEPFYRSPVVVARQIRGTGLGLTLAKRKLQGLGGAISVSSVPGKGTTFVLHLPPARREAAAVAVESCAAS